MSQIKKEAILEAISNGDVKPDKNGLVHYQVVWGKKGATHQHQVSGPLIKRYELRKLTKKLQQINSKLELGDEDLKNPDKLRERKAKIEEKIEKLNGGD